MSNGITAVELGTTKVTVLIGRPKRDGSLELLGLGSEACYPPNQAGGAYSNLQAFRNPLRAALGQARKMAGTIGRRCVLGIPNEFCGLVRTEKTLEVPSSGIGKAETARLKRETEDRPLPAEWRIGPVFYEELAPHEDSLRPGAIVCQRASLICLHRSFVRDAAKLLSGAGLRCDKAVPALLAQGNRFLTVQERHKGALFLDIGGFCTDIVYYRHGIPIHMDWFPLGGASLTGDIVQGLGIGWEEAERLKRSCVLGLDIAAGSGPEGMDYAVRQGSRILNVQADLLLTIVEARMEEILDLALNSLREIQALRPDTPVVLAGGGAALFRGARAFVSRQLGLPLRLGVPDCIGLSSPAFSAAYGLVLETETAAGRSPWRAGLHRLIRRMMQ